MEIRIWNYNLDKGYIRSFLSGMSIAHAIEPYSEEWFQWKFEQSPYGPAILATAFDGDQVAGCVAYGRGIVRYLNKEWSCALSYETFVRPDYQGHGLFKKLILAAEQEMSRLGIQFLYNFPNSNSLPGFKRMKWIQANEIGSYKISLCTPLKCMLNVMDLRKSFKPCPANLQKISNIVFDNLPLETSDPHVITPIWTSEYLKWRFFTLPNREYHVANNDEFFAISMVGYRGSLKNAVILYSVPKQSGRPTYEVMKSVIRELASSVKPDVISYSSTIFDSALKNVRGFIKVPSHANFCYKVFDEQMHIEQFKISLPSINSHTY